MADLLRVHRLCLVAAARATSTRTTRAIFTRSVILAS